VPKLKWSLSFAGKIDRFASRLRQIKRVAPEVEAACSRYYAAPSFAPAAVSEVGRAVTFRDSGGSYVLEEVPAFASTVPTTGIDINDDGAILASYTDTSGNVSTYLLTPVP